MTASTTTLSLPSPISLSSLPLTLLLASHSPPCLSLSSLPLTLLLASHSPPCLSLSSLPALRPALAFYAKCAKDFQDLANTPAEAYYTRDAYINLPHGASFTGRDHLWAFYKQLYEIFRANPIEQFYTLTVASDATGTHTLHMEYVRGLHNHNGSSVTRVPQVFVYEIGPATEGEGTDSLQIRGLRCYDDVGLMRAAARAEGVEVKEFESAQRRDGLRKWVNATKKQVEKEQWVNKTSAGYSGDPYVWYH